MSYSHDSEEHKEWVRKISTDLRQHLGVDVILDQWDLRIGSDLSLFMEQGLSSAMLVMCVCSDQYVVKANIGVGGTGYEKMILTSELIKNTNTDFIIPILRNNKERNLPIFLGTKKYVDFTEEKNYLENLRELTARIYNEDITRKPPLGESPYSQKIVNEITVKTQIEKTAYHNPEMSGSTSFDFENNSGKFYIGSGEYEFCSSWSKCGPKSIYGYKDNVGMIG